MKFSRYLNGKQNYHGEIQSSASEKKLFFFLKKFPESHGKLVKPTSSRWSALTTVMILRLWSVL